MSKLGGNISLKSYDEIFTTQEERDERAANEQGVEKVKQLDLAKLQPFKNHPFKVKDDEEMDKGILEGETLADGPQSVFYGKALVPIGTIVLLFAYGRGVREGEGEKERGIVENN